MSVTDEETLLVGRLKKLPLARAGGFIFIKTGNPIFEKKHL
jgi:hypothetical protein